MVFVITLKEFTMYNFEQPKILNFKSLGDERGQLVVLQNSKEIPFDVKRTYFLYGTKPDVPRGFHAHKKLQQVLICVSGSCDIHCECCGQKQKFILDNPQKGLLLTGMTWHEMHNFSSDAVLLVLADDFYEESDYVRDYDEFLKLTHDNCL